MLTERQRVTLLLLLSVVAILAALWSLKGPWQLHQKERPQAALRYFSDDAFYQPAARQKIESPINPIPHLLVLSADLQRRVDLGRQLFRDTRLSGSEEVSCLSCHVPGVGGHDPRGDSLGLNGVKLGRNTPTVLNATFNVKLFWDGRSPDLLDQVSDPIGNPNEMNGKWPDIIDRLRSDPEMVKQFAIYPQGITVATISDAIALYERTLVTPDSPFDRYLMGDNTAITEKQKSGYERFVKYGCVSCHQGRNVGGNLFEKIGIYATKQQLEQFSESDLGRYRVTGDISDTLVFRVPSLRNVALTAPYFRNGSRPTLRDAVSSMGRFQLGKELSDEDVDHLVAFLESLSGDLEGSD